MIDTGMQEEARSLEPSVFPSAPVFADAKASGMLSTPEATAAKLAELLFRHDFPHGEIVKEL